MCELENQSDTYSSANKIAGIAIDKTDLQVK